MFLMKKKQQQQLKQKQQYLRQHLKIWAWARWDKTIGECHKIKETDLERKKYKQTKTNNSKKIMHKTTRFLWWKLGVVQSIFFCIEDGNKR